MRGLCANREDLSILLADADPIGSASARSIVYSSLSSRNLLTADKRIKFNNYTTYCMPAVEANGTPHGGVALLIKNGSQSDFT